MTFDELVMGSALPRGWRVLGPADSVELAAFPTPFDRSLRLATSRAGVATVVCYPTRGSMHVSVDAYAGHPAGMAFTLRDPVGGGELAIRVDESGHIVTGAGDVLEGDATVNRDEWYRVSFVIEPTAGMIAVRAAPRDATGSVLADARLPARWDHMLPAPDLCVTSPAAAGEVAYLDNLSIGQD